MVYECSLSELIEKGQWNAIVNKYTAQPQVCPDMSGMPIEFANCFTAFLILISGAILGLLCLFAEFVMKPFDHLLGFIQEHEQDLDEVETMDRSQLEFTVSQQKEAITRLKTEIKMYQQKFVSHKWLWLHKIQLFCNRVCWILQNLLPIYLKWNIYHPDLEMVNF